MDGRSEGRMDGRTDGRTEGRRDEQKDERKDGGKDEWTDGVKDGWMDGRTRHAPAVNQLSERLKTRLTHVRQTRRHQYKAIVALFSGDVRRLGASEELEGKDAFADVRDALSSAANRRIKVSTHGIIDNSHSNSGSSSSNDNDRSSDICRIETPEVDQLFSA